MIEGKKTMSKSHSPQPILEKPWLSLIPESYSWCKKVHMRVVSKIDDSKSSVHFVCLSDDGTKSSLHSSALSDSDKTELLKKYSLVYKKGTTGSVEYKGSSYVLVPASKIETTDAQISRQFGLDASAFSKGLELTAMAIHGDSKIGWSSAFEGFSHGLFDPAIFSARDEKSGPGIMIESVEVLDAKAQSAEVQKAQAFAQSVALCRFLQETPANWLTPEKFAEIAKDVSQEHSLKIKTLNRKDLTALGAGSFLSVAQGSNKDAYIIALEIDGKDNSQTVAYVGKGLTFDTGGNSLKPSLGMGEMKYDMSGGAAVLATAKYLGQYKPQYKTICMIGAVENMPGPDATRPGDVVVAMNGKSIDVQNTDAEGRLVLADCITYAIREYKPKKIIDIATLTGACLHALGHVGAGLMSNSDKLAAEVIDASKVAGEPFWRLPLWPELRKEIKGDVSDYKNIANSSVMAGTIVGGLFLEEFVEKTEWAHLDIAGTGWQCAAVGFPGKLGSAFGFRTLVALAGA